MTVVNLVGLETLLGVSGPIDAALVQMTYWAGTGAFTGVDDEDVTFPPSMRVEIVNGDPVVELSLVPTTAECCLRWEIWTPGHQHVLLRYTSIPASGPPVDFGDLPVVDPASFVPVSPTPTLIQTIDARIAEVGVPEEQIAEAVSDYLTDNPPNAGVTHSQMVASSSWVIAHGFGRLPNVAVYIDGAEVDADVTSTTVTVTVTFASPQTGVAVLN